MGKMRKDNTERSRLHKEILLPENKHIGYGIALILCIVAYLSLMMLIIRLSSDRENIWIYLNDNIKMYKSAVSGIICQILILISVLIVLNPIKRSTLIAVLLNVIMTFGALSAIMLDQNLDALAGIAAPFVTVFVVLIISRYGNNLKREIRKVMKYNQMMKENDERLHMLAYYDNLTGLPNRRNIIDYMENLVAQEGTENQSFFYVLIDLDDFKKINDIAGHSVGDEILKKIAERWERITKQEDVLGRIGGDEFSLLIPRRLSMDELETYLTLFRSVLSKEITVEHKGYNITASYGVTRYPEDGINPVELFKNADIALYKGKNDGKNCIWHFNKELQNEIIHKIKLEQGLQSSIRNNELYMVFQPLFHCGSRTLRGFEALARWRYPEIGHVSPAQFIPIAEETGLIIDMGKWIITSVLQRFMEYQSAFNIRTIVSINISVVQMVDPNFVPMIKEIIQETGYDSRYLELEITESVLISYPEKIITVINQLKEMGIRISLDDFGTGYASLSNLQQLPINILKIDKTFIDTITNQQDRNQIVGNIISLAHQLGIEVVAEGVEKEEQLEYLKQHNCDFIQGYLLSRPIEEEQIVTCYMQAQQS